MAFPTLLCSSDRTLLQGTNSDFWTKWTRSRLWKALCIRTRLKPKKGPLLKTAKLQAKGLGQNKITWILSWWCKPLPKWPTWSKTRMKNKARLGPSKSTLGTSAAAPKRCKTCRPQVSSTLSTISKPRVRPSRKLIQSKLKSSWKNLPTLWAP